MWVVKDHPIYLMYWYGASTIFTIVNYARWVRFNADLFGDDVERAYVAFAVLTTLVFIFVSGLCFFWAQYYCDKDTKEGIKARNFRVNVGMFFIYFFSDTPLFIIDLVIVYNVGWVDEIQGITFILKLTSWMIGTFFVWFVYMWKMSKLLHKKTGADRDIQLGGAPGFAFNLAALNNVAPDV
eukprot:TRINITY_DN2845_c4_g1_i2.p1 TRINITY_DN2845_c4_g1~~TRINITY_DN2845_c4_g1_i2.p1  ORF type:complete len:182 (+),score=20.08 TRINITY_DN2845_c4_g1_i2:45-590(+)